MRIVGFIFASFLLLFSPQARADYCPKTIGAIVESDLGEATILILKDLYKRLGCDLNLTYQPSKRVIHNFNNSKVDGEVMRYPVIESLYTKPFVRSDVPLIDSINGEWRHPDEAFAKTRSTGVVFGIAWQEKHRKELVEPLKKVITFHTHEEMIDAYNRGNIGSFWIVKPALRLALQAETIKPPPVLSRVITRSKFYHYLDAKYAKFMADFSEIVRNENPFAKLE